MSRRFLLPFAVGALLFGAVPALADANGSTEVQTVDRKCDAPSDNRYSPPGAGDCKDGATTYKSKYNSNDVKCGGKNVVGPTGGLGTKVYASQAGGIGTCSDGTGSTPAPVQGRATLSGNTTDGARLAADGDKDNSNASSQGYLIVQAKPGAAPTVRCGDEHAQGGKADSDFPQDRDNQAECGS
jgi:hypothetical protein